MNKLIVFGFLLGFVLFAMSYHEASAVCCFPYDMIHYIDPETVNLVVSGELWNDSYRGLPFGNSKYEFVFHNSTGEIIFEKDIVITKEHPIQNGFVIHPGIAPLPFQITLDDVDSDMLKHVPSISTGRTSVQYFEWKPPDLDVQLGDFSKIDTIKSKTQENTFDKWQISGTITNTHSQMTQNVYVLASLYNTDHNIAGVAGYSDDDIQPMTLEDHEIKEFKIHALVPQSKPVQNLRLYAESNDSSTKYDETKPLILRPAHVPIKHGVEGTPITISANVTNITRDDAYLDWIIQIKKSPKSFAEGDISKYPNSTVAFLKMIPASISAQGNQILEYQWVPESGGIYFYEMFLWEKYKPISLWFRGSFLYSDQILVSTNSLKDQLSKNIPLDELHCRNDLIMVHKSSNSNFVCVKPESLPKLVERGWTTPENTLETEKLWKSTEEWNSLRLVRNSDDGLYCSSNKELSDHCYSLEEIVFGNGHKRSNQGWKMYPGAGIILPDNTTLTPVYKNSTLGLPQIDLNAMLDDKTFVDKCQSHGGTWNHSRHDCEGLMQVCNDIGGIYLNEDVTPPCTNTGVIDEDPLKVKVCRGAALIRISCVFEYEG